MPSRPLPPATFGLSRRAGGGSAWWVERLRSGLIVGVACVVGVPLFLLLYYGVPAAATLWWSLQLWPALLAWLLVPPEHPFLYLGICVLGALATLKPVFVLSQWGVATVVGRLLGGHTTVPGRETPPLWRRTHQRRVILMETDVPRPAPGTEPARPGRMVVLEDTVVEECLAPPPLSPCCAWGKTSIGASRPWADGDGREEHRRG